MHSSSIANRIADLLEMYVISSDTACIIIFGVAICGFAYCMYKLGSYEEEYDFFLSNIDNGVVINDDDGEPITDRERKTEVIYSICNNYKFSIFRCKLFGILHLLILFLCLVFALF